jgi:hypothetical protein
MSLATLNVSYSQEHHKVFLKLERRAVDLICGNPCCDEHIQISGLTTKISHAIIISSKPATCPNLLILLDFITLIVFGEEQANKL